MELLLIIFPVEPQKQNIALENVITKDNEIEEKLFFNVSIATKLLKLLYQEKECTVLKNVFKIILKKD